MRKKVRDQFYNHLPKELLEKRTKSGDITILNWIGWAKAYLKAAKLVEQPERAVVKITEKGEEILKTGSYTVTDMQNDPDYQEHISKREALKEDLEDNSNASPEDMIDTGINAIDDQVKTELLEKLKTIDPYYFERVILELLKNMGYGDFLETSKSGDGGIDGIINQDKLGLEKIYVQAKRYNENKVREKDIRNFIGAMSGDTNKGVFVTTSEFDDGAIVKAKEAIHKIILVDGNKLVALMHQYNVGVQIKDVYEVKQIDEDFFENNI